MNITVSGKTYSACLDPLATQVPGEFGFPEPTVRRIGKGCSYTYRLTKRQVRDLLWHLDVMAECFDLPGDPSSQAEARAIRKDAHRIAARLAEYVARGESSKNP